MDTNARTKALNNGRLIDISDAAKQCGIDSSIAISLNLWASCVRPHHGCLGPEEHLAVDQLISLLRLQLCRTLWLDELDTVVPLPVTYYWTDSISVRLLLGRSPLNKPEATILFESESVDSLSNPLPAPLPAHPLYRLSAAVHTFNRLRRIVDRTYSLRLSQYHAALLHGHPLATTISYQAHKYSPPEYLHSDPGSSRRVLLDSIAEILKQLQLATSPAHQVTLSELLLQVDALREPMNDFLHLVLSLVLFANKLQNAPPATIQSLILAYNELLIRYNNGDFDVPSRLLAQVGLSFRELCTHVPAAWTMDFDRLFKEFHDVEARISDRPSLDAPPKSLWV